MKSEGSLCWKLDNLGYLTWHNKMILMSSWKVIRVKKCAVHTWTSGRSYNLFDNDIVTIASLLVKSVARSRVIVPREDFIFKSHPIVTTFQRFAMVWSLYPNNYNYSNNDYDYCNAAATTTTSTNAPLTIFPYFSLSTVTTTISISICSAYPYHHVFYV